MLEKPIYDISEADGVITFYYLQDKETTAINAPTIAVTPKQAVYDLSGRRIAQPTQGGIYIQNGKKVVVK